MLALHWSDVHTVFPGSGNLTGFGTVDYVFMFICLGNAFIPW